MRRRVLILCTGNSARSQLAEALLSHRAGDRFEVASAGTAPAARVHPLAIAVLDEVGIAWRGRQPKDVASVDGGHWDLVITVCDHARESCPVFHGSPLQVHWGLPDPAAVTGDPDATREAFRRVRDTLSDWVRQLAEESFAGDPGLVRQRLARIGAAVPPDLAPTRAGS